MYLLLPDSLAETADSATVARGLSQFFASRLLELGSSMLFLSSCDTDVSVVLCVRVSRESVASGRADKKMQFLLQEETVCFRTVREASFVYRREQADQQEKCVSEEKNVRQVFSRQSFLCSHQLCIL